MSQQLKTQNFCIRLSYGLGVYDPYVQTLQFLVQLKYTMNLNATFPQEWALEKADQMKKELCLITGCLKEVAFLATHRKKFSVLQRPLGIMRWQKMVAAQAAKVTSFVIRPSFHQIAEQQSCSRDWIFSRTGLGNRKE